MTTEEGNKLIAEFMGLPSLTFCNMLVDQLAPTDFKNYSMTSNGVCKSCLLAITKNNNS